MLQGEWARFEFINSKKWGNYCWIHTYIQCLFNIWGNKWIIQVSRYPKKSTGYHGCFEEARKIADWKCSNIFLERAKKYLDSANQNLSSNANNNLPGKCKWNTEHYKLISKGDKSITWKVQMKPCTGKENPS